MNQNSKKPPQQAMLQINPSAGLGWLLFWTQLVFFVGVLSKWWTWESMFPVFLWITGAVLISISPPFTRIIILKPNDLSEKKPPSRD